MASDCPCSHACTGRRRRSCLSNCSLSGFPEQHQLCALTQKWADGAVAANIQRPESTLVFPGISRVRERNRRAGLTKGVLSGTESNGGKHGAVAPLRNENEGESLDENPEPPLGAVGGGEVLQVAGSARRGLREVQRLLHCPFLPKAAETSGTRMNRGCSIGCGSPTPSTQNAWEQAQRSQRSAPSCRPPPSRLSQPPPAPLPLCHSPPGSQAPSAVKETERNRTQEA